MGGPLYGGSNPLDPAPPLPPLPPAMHWQGVLQGIGMPQQQTTALAQEQARFNLLASEFERRVRDDMAQIAMMQSQFSQGSQLDHIARQQLLGSVSMPLGPIAQMMANEFAAMGMNHEGLLYGAGLANSAVSREAQEVMDEVENHETLEEMLPRIRKLHGSWKVSTFAHRKCCGRVTKRETKC